MTTTLPMPREEHRSTGSSGVIPAVQLMAWGLLCGWLLFGVPRYVHIFEDFGLMVSSGSMLAIQLADLATMYWPFILVGLAVLGCLSYLADDAFARAGSVLLRGVWLIAGVAVPIIITTATYLALESDLGALVDAVT